MYKKTILLSQRATESMSILYSCCTSFNAYNTSLQLNSHNFTVQGCECRAPIKKARYRQDIPVYSQNFTSLSQGSIHMCVDPRHVVGNISVNIGYSPPGAARPERGQPPELPAPPGAALQGASAVALEIQRFLN